jgi:spore maturation protein CgeB
VKIVLFYHSFLSCWNHGNAHFLRGYARALVQKGHEVVVWEPEDAWSRLNAVADGGEHILAETSRLIPGIVAKIYDPVFFDAEELLDDADVAIVHEWNDPEIVARLGAVRRRRSDLLLLFHDTHHRAVTKPEEIDRLRIEDYDAVLAYGAALTDVYARQGWGTRAYTWHEAADTALFKPLPNVSKNLDLVWMGNWGDGERGEELEAFLMAPIAQLRLKAQIYGVRYPSAVRQSLARHDIEYGGWLPNHYVPAAFARAKLTLHVPRRPYASALPGIPTIRMFEALACGIPLICSTWRDAESLFPTGSYLAAESGEAMTSAIADVLHDPGMATEMTSIGLASIRSRHSSAHRVEELLGIIGGLRADDAPSVSCSARKEQPSLTI